MPAMAGWLATLGTLLIGMSTWQSVEIEGGVLRLRIAKLSEAVALQSCYQSRRSIDIGRSAPIQDVISTAAGDDWDDTAHKDYLEKLATFQSLAKKLEAEGIHVGEYWPRSPRGEASANQGY